jgi:hypothetical protein
MPVTEFQCTAGHVTERITLSIAQSERMGDKVKCEKCNRTARRKMSQTAKPILVGDGFSNPTVREPEHWKDYADHTVIDH